MNRALLARQLLLRRATLSTGKALEHLVGLQAQIPNSPYIGLLARLANYRPDELARFMADGRAVRGVLMRGTLHVVTARDYRALRPLVQPVLTRALNGNFRRAFVGLAPRVVAATGRTLLRKTPLTGTRLSAALKKRWPDRDARSLGYAVQYLVPIVQVPPRGVWGKTAAATWALADAWTGALEARPSLETMVMRYLAAFGPATVADIRAWSGLAGLNDVIARLRRRLVVFGDETGRELFDLRDAPRPDPDTPAPPRFLPCYDNALLSHADRARVFGPVGRVEGFPGDQLHTGTVLVDGFIGARWKVERGRDKATLVIEPFKRLRSEDRAAVTEEGLGLLAFATPDAARRDVRFARPT